MQNFFTYCPRCGASGLEFNGANRFSCSHCGLVYYHNTAAAVGLVVASAQGVLFEIRQKEPRKGFLALPGGFIVPGESAEEGVLRECREEIGWLPPRESVHYLCSFPNVYPYKDVTYNTCDLFYCVDAPDLALKDLSLEASEVAQVKFVPLGDIKEEELGFPSSWRALQVYKTRISG
jgi:ADP-ribose pyrophosphatase YjhB (NUDIX family)